MVIAIQRSRTALYCIQLVDNFRFVGPQILGQLHKECSQLGIICLSGDFAGPIHTQVEVTAAVVKFAGLARR